METILSLESDRLHFIGRSLDNPRRISIPRGVTVVAGQNGSGKSTLGLVIEKGRNLATNRICPAQGLKVKRIEFNDIHSLTGDKVEYYQQRYESMANDEVPTVAELFSDCVASEQWKNLARTLRIEHIVNHPLNFLSSGELRKLLISIVLTSEPVDLLILDNPYIGLDVASRRVLDEIIPRLAEQGVSVMLLVCDSDDVPAYADSLITMENMTITGRYDRRDGVNLSDIAAGLFDYAVDTARLPRRVPGEEKSGDEVVRMENCTVRYGKTVILSDINWTVNRGECWALTGPNGSGKSTLLSLVHADNPQVYSNRISIFGRRRGTGESIWDVKRRIGYVSPEMHLFFHSGSYTTAEVIARGMLETLGFFTRIGEREMSKAKRWIEIFHLEELADQRFSTLSAGQQRLVLLVRTLVKNPELLILDEPLHGLDRARKRAVRAVVNALAERDEVTVIYVTHRAEEVPECVNHVFTLPAPQR